MSSASPIVPATDPLKTYTRLIALGGNIEQPSALTPILGTSLSTRLVHCRKLITRLTLEARTDPQSIPNIAYGLAAHCSDSDEPQGINASSNGALILPWRETTSMNREVAGPDAMDGIRDLTVGMGTVVNSTATGADKERFAIVSLGYAGKELKLDGLAAGNSTASRANATAVSVKSNGVWKQSESSAAGCALTGIEAVYPSFISGVRLYFSCPASTPRGSGDPQAFFIAASTGPSDSDTAGFGMMTFAAMGAGFAVLLIVAMVVGLGCRRRRNTNMFNPKPRV